MAKQLHIRLEDNQYKDIAEYAKLAGMTVYAVHDKSAENQKAELLNLADKYIYNIGELL